MPNIWAMNLCFRLDILQHKHLGRRKVKVYNAKSIRSFFLQSLLSTLFAWLSANFFAITGSVPDVTSGSDFRWNGNWMLQSTDFFSNMMLALTCVLGQLSWFLIIWRLVRFKTIRFGHFSFLPFLGFAVSVFLLLGRYQDLGISYQHIYVSSPQQFVMFMIPISIVFFVGVERVRVGHS